MQGFKTYYDLFHNEELCARILKEARQQQEIICRKCGNEAHYWKRDKMKFECKKCRYRTSLKKGTVMENSNLPLQYWFPVIAYISHTNGKITAHKLQKELEHNRYEPILRMVKKVKHIPETDLIKQKILQYVYNETTKPNQ